MRKMPKCFSSKFLSVIAAALILAIDQFTKSLIISCPDKKQVVASFFNIVLVKNKGIAFGMLGDIVSPAVFAFVAVAVVFSLLIFTNKTSYYRLPVVIIVAGAIGNVIDRLAYGAVIDFLDFHLYGYHWPAFNIADIAIVVGTSMLFLTSCLEKENRI